MESPSNKKESTTGALSDMINRDVDWLSFNSRVLSEAENTDTPLFERLKFLAIFSSNLDEFFKVRVSKLRQIKSVEKKLRKPLGLKPNKTLKQILSIVNAQQERMGTLFNQILLPELRSNHMAIVSTDQLDSAQIGFLEGFFDLHLLPKVQILDHHQIRPADFKDGQLYLVVASDTSLSFISVPVKEVGRFVRVPSSDTIETFLFVEDIVVYHLDRLLPEQRGKEAYSIKVSRDAELYLEDEYYGNWVDKMNEYLERRQLGQPTRLLYQGNMPLEVVERLQKIMDIGMVDMVRGGRYHNFSDFFNFPFPQDREELFYNPMPPLDHHEFEGVTDYFQLIAQQDRIVHFPYQKFDYLEQWLHQAAVDKDVIRIQISLYRIAKDSSLTRALLNALANGKEVHIFVEAKARFDEENNLVWGKVFEEHGAKVQYSFPNVKVHSKILLIERMENNKPCFYAYIGTGNFNAKTAKIYCDHGLFTADKQITQDLSQVFQVLQRKVILPLHKELIVSPYTSRLVFEHLIQQEIENAKNGLPSAITMKMNSLEDGEMVQWLYKAGNAGVPIRLVIRGICCLVPGLPGKSESIQVTSIVDRFLEHGRLFLFHNNGAEKMFMGSADWMGRNLDRRIEVIVPIKDQDVFHQLKHILDLQLSDNVKARIRHPRMDNEIAINNGDRVRSQYAIYDYLKSRRDS
jgi:polyphosphate kinase